MTWYATLDDAKSMMRAGSSSDTVGDVIVKSLLQMISRRIDRLFPTHSPAQAPFFAPFIETREFPLRFSDVNSWERTWRIGDPLLALTAVTVGTDALILNSDVKAWPPLTTPLRKLILASGTTQWYSYNDSNDDPLRVIVAGTWGWHHDWANAWLSVDTVQNNPLTAGGTSLTLADVDGADPYGRTPRISAGNLLKIENEYLEVSATDTAGNTATVRRGVNGSTAAAHVQTTAVSVFQVEDDLRHVVARQAGAIYARRGAYEQVEISGIGLTQYPPDLLSELKAVLTGYAYE